MILFNQACLIFKYFKKKFQYFINKTEKNILFTLILSILFHLLMSIIIWQKFQPGKLAIHPLTHSKWVLEAQLLPEKTTHFTKKLPVLLPKIIKPTVPIAAIKSTPETKIKHNVTKQTPVTPDNTNNIEKSLILPPKPDVVTHFIDSNKNINDEVLPIHSNHNVSNNDVFNSLLSDIDKPIGISTKSIKSKESIDSSTNITNPTLPNDLNNPLPAPDSVAADTYLVDNQKRLIKSELPIGTNIQSPPNTLPLNNKDLPYQLPKTLQVSYDTYVQDITHALIYKDKSILEFSYLKNKTGINGNNSEFSYIYNAQLNIKSNNLIDTDLSTKYAVKGNLTVYDLRPTYIKEKNDTHTVTTTIDTNTGQVFISNQTEFIAYDARRQDILSVIIQLGINQQMDSRWLIPGTVQDFTVYRPNGLTTWRFQSQGIQTVKIGDQNLELLYVKRISLDDQIDYEDEQHFWLDPKRYGFPIKMRFTRQNGQYTEFILNNWEE